MGGFIVAAAALLLLLIFAMTLAAVYEGDRGLSTIPDDEKTYWTWLTRYSGVPTLSSASEGEGPEITHVLTCATLEGEVACRIRAFPVARRSGAVWDLRMVHTYRFELPSGGREKVADALARLRDQPLSPPSSGLTPLQRERAIVEAPPWSPWAPLRDAPEISLDGDTLVMRTTNHTTSNTHGNTLEREIEALHLVSTALRWIHGRQAAIDFHHAMLRAYDARIAEGGTSKATDETSRIRQIDVQNRRYASRQADAVSLRNPSRPASIQRYHAMELCRLQPTQQALHAFATGVCLTGGPVEQLTAIRFAGRWMPDVADGLLDDATLDATLRLTLIEHMVVHAPNERARRAFLDGAADREVQHRHTDAIVAILDAIDRDPDAHLDTLAALVTYPHPSVSGRSIELLDRVGATAHILRAIARGVSAHALELALARLKGNVEDAVIADALAEAIHDIVRRCGPEATPPPQEEPSAGIWPSRLVVADDANTRSRNLPRVRSETDDEMLLCYAPAIGERGARQHVATLNAVLLTSPAPPSHLRWALLGAIEEIQARSGSGAAHGGLAIATNSEAGALAFERGMPRASTVGALSQSEEEGERLTASQSEGLAPQEFSAHAEASLRGKSR